MTHDEIIAVVKAHKEGKEIQYKGASGIFEKMPWDWSFNFASYTYRIKPELTREEITAKWVKDNDVKEGDIVKVIADIQDCDFIKANHLANYKWRVATIWKDGISICKGEHSFSFPVESLQKIKSKTVLFTFEDREEFRGKWVRKINYKEIEVLVTVITREKVRIGNDYLTYEEALEMLEFIDGRPFGKEIWE